jgi:NAD(P)-dependent dehydrogenase (short-subunit alcohol dehydrogenase family)
VALNETGAEERGDSLGLYAVTGGSKGIGEATVGRLRAAGHEVLNVDISGGDINADIGTAKGRLKIISELHDRCPDGLDGLVSNAGIASSDKLSYVLSVNFFGAVAVTEGVYDLLKLKKGNCVMTVSGSIAYAVRGKYYVDELLVNCGDEARIGALVDTFDPGEVDNAVYGSTKIALVRWIRRTAPAWAVQGVSLNGVAPGGVATTIMQGVKHMGANPKVFGGLVMPTIYREALMMAPAEIAAALAFMVQPDAKGCSGHIVYCDGGTSALINPEKFY